ncbi:hypothetical protein C8R44DRAFT_980835 [Mycena epipterygia]|nr:hypothetical protein C8R44DRAFT_980835 [Mycena epipterygia]
MLGDPPTSAQPPASLAPSAGLPTARVTIPILYNPRPISSTVKSDSFDVRRVGPHTFVSPAFLESLETAQTSPRRVPTVAVRHPRNARNARHRAAFPTHHTGRQIVKSLTEDVSMPCGNTSDIPSSGVPIQPGRLPAQKHPSFLKSQEVRTSSQSISRIATEIEGVSIASRKASNFRGSGALSASESGSLGLDTSARAPSPPSAILDPIVRALKSSRPDSQADGPAGQAFVTSGANCDGGGGQSISRHPADPRPHTIVLQRRLALRLVWICTARYRRISGSGMSTILGKDPTTALGGLRTKDVQAGRQLVYRARYSQ